MRVPPHRLIMTSAALIAAVAAVVQIASACDNCTVLSKEAKAMFRAHSSACSSQSHLESSSPLLKSLFDGELVEDDQLKAHIYCVLQRCKIVGKDGKPLKSAALLQTKDEALERCMAEQNGDTPDAMAWNFFRCASKKKSILFHHMAADRGPKDLESNTN